MSEQCLCEKCGKHFTNADNFKRHLTELHKSVVGFLCEDCGKTFTRLSNFQRHRTVHDIVVGDFLCEKCGKTFHRKDYYESHKNSCDSRQNFQCPLCRIKNSKESLLNHFVVVHGIHMNDETKTFMCLKDFEVWKDQYEKENLLQYTQGAKYTAQDGTKFYQFCCNRGAHFQPKDTNVQNIKSYKTYGWCPSIIRVNVDTEGKVSVTFMKTHVGHDIGKKLMTAEVTNITIVNGTGDSVTNIGLDSTHSAPQMDNSNIRKKHNLKNALGVKYTKNKNVDRTQRKRVKVKHPSVESWVQEKTNKDCVQFFKARGSASLKYPQLISDGFFLLIMTKSQAEFLKKFGERFVCVDCQNGETFEFVTLMVLDDMNQSFPCAFLFTNKISADVMNVFFTEIKNVVGTVHTKLFMSGKSNFVCDVWENVMIPPEKKLFCSWDVLKAWKFNMCMIVNEEKQATIFKALQSVLEETDVNSFTSTFEIILSDLYIDPETANFASYFADNYSETETWACCFRSNEGIPVNFQLEKMHSMFKHILKGNSTKRIDKAINAIVTFVRSKVYDRLILMSNGKVSSKLSEMRHRHRFAEKFTYDVTNYGDYWRVVSGKREENKVRVGNKECRCELKCIICNVCAHYYTCTCFDSTVRLNMCRHIHSLCMSEAAGNINVCMKENSTESDDMSLKQHEDYTDCGVFKVEEEILIVDKSMSDEDIDISLDTIYEGETEILTTEKDADYNELLYDEETCQEEVISTFEESIPSSTETIESMKGDLACLFKAVLNNVHSEEQMEEVRKAITPLQNTVKALNQSDANSKKRAHEETEIQNEETVNIFESYPSCLKIPRN